MQWMRRLGEMRPSRAGWPCGLLETGAQGRISAQGEDGRVFEALQRGRRGGIREHKGRVVQNGVRRWPGVLGFPSQRGRSRGQVSGRGAMASDVSVKGLLAATRADRRERGGSGAWPGSWRAGARAPATGDGTCAAPSRPVGLDLCFSPETRGPTSDRGMGAVGA